MTLRREIRKILENTILPEGISNEEMKEKGIKEYQMYIDNRSYNYSMKFKRYNA